MNMWTWVVDESGDWDWHMCTAMYKQLVEFYCTAQGVCYTWYPRSSVMTQMGRMLGWGEVEGSSKREKNVCVYIFIHLLVQQKLMQNCKATIPQLKKNTRSVDNIHQLPITCQVLGWVLGQYSRDEADQFLSARSLHSGGWQQQQNKLGELEGTLVP